MVYLNARIAILLITLLCPGLAVVGVSLYWFNLDYAAPIKAERYVENLVEVGKHSLIYSCPLTDPNVV
ncbi:hypothetical protein [Nostoc sp. NMS8]|uniref:hypothetical protein n=1 Tax=Nostoc sp. NMS8 TaxID=2815392 RepID=UPI0025D4D867|nr:hypothetical protein [Nostoc sp. NMS8]MBN3962467.1 hypothetical protein [Nostoc sp. NMS8]